MKNLSDIPEKPISLSRVSENPGPYCMSFHFELDPLVRSIEKIGLIHSPLVVRNRGGNLDVVIGYRRMLALKSMKQEEVPMKDLSELNVKPVDLLLLNFYDNLSIRSFNEVEKGMILNRLKPYLSEVEIRERFMPLLDLPPHEEVQKIYGKLEALDPTLKVSCAAGDLSYHTIKALLEMDFDSRTALFGWIKDLRFNFNQQQLFIENTEDISMREELSVLQVLRDESLIGVRNDEKLNNPQKAKRVLDLLRSRRFPLLIRSEEAFRKGIAHLDLPERVKISHPPFFEDSHYRLEIGFENGKKLRETIKQLDGLKDLEGIGDPWENKTE